MNWFKGSIPESINLSRERKSIFVVVITDESDESMKLLEVIEKDEQALKIFKNFVAISLKNGSNEAQQFSQLYPIVILPSIYLIGQNGSPLEIIGGLVDAQVLLSRCQAALDLHNKQCNIHHSEQEKAPVDEQLVATSDSHSQQEAQSSVDVQSAESINSGMAPESDIPLDVRVERANQLLAAVREKKRIEEREKEKAKERERRELGKQLQQLKDAQKEREQRELVDSRQKEKREEKEALEKIRQQIAQDRADRSARYQAAQHEEEARKRAAQNAQEQLQQERAAARSAFSRLQFRLPDGSTRTEQFSADVNLIQVTNFIDSVIQPPFKSYTLCTTFPRKEFLKTDMDKSLRALDLAPSAALLIIPSTSTTKSLVARTSGSSSWISSFFAPLYWAWMWIWTLIFPSGNRASVTQSTPSQPSNHQENFAPAINQGGVRRRTPAGNSNIHRLADASADDSSDDNATWNGNSTQQL